MVLYQKAIEFFSAIEDPLYVEYTNKLKLMLQREDVTVILKSKEGKLFKKNFLLQNKKEKKSASKQTNKHTDKQTNKNIKFRKEKPNKLY